MTTARAVSRLRHKPSLTKLSESGRITGYVRTDNDSWDITTSVGSTALFVATARALEAQKAHPVVLDQFAEVFCRAAGSEWADMLDGGAADHPLRPSSAATSSTSRPCAPSISTTTSRPRLRSGCDRSSSSPRVWTRGPIGCAGRTGRWSSSWTNRGCWTSNARRWLRAVSSLPPCVWRSQSTCATTGHRPCATAGLTRRNRRHGSPRDCSSTCRPRHSASCSQASTHWPRLAVGSPSRSPCRWPPTLPGEAGRRSRGRQRPHLLHPRLQRAARACEGVVR